MLTALKAISKNNNPNDILNIIFKMKLALKRLEQKTENMIEITKNKEAEFIEAQEILRNLPEVPTFTPSTTDKEQEPVQDKITKLEPHIPYK